MKWSWAHLLVVASVGAAVLWLITPPTAAEAWAGAAWAVAAEAEGEGAGQPTFHAADQNSDRRIDLSELLRVIQFFNSTGLHCEEGTEDGFAPGSGDTAGCLPHSADYNTQDWFLSLSELLRVIQFFNSGGYRLCGGGEDGYCPGLPPNIVFILIDAMRADRVNATRNDVPVAPFSAALAAGGAHFTRATSAASWTRPAMLSLFTGVYPQVFRGADVSEPSSRFLIPESYLTMAEWLGSHGYDNWAVQTNPGHLTDTTGFTQGYPDGQYLELDFAPATAVTDAALGVLSQWREPFYTYLHYIDPHVLYNPPQAYRDIFAPLPELTEDDVFNLSNDNFKPFYRELDLAWIEDRASTYVPLSAGGIEALHTIYDGEIRYVDDEAARLVAAIEESYPNTIFIITADHGESLREREIIGHGLSLYEEDSRVPAIFKGPGIPSVVIDRPVETVGLLPTLARLLELPGSPQWQGRDLFTEAPDAPIYSHTRANFKGYDIEASSVLQGGMKLIEHNIVGTPQLYDLDTDPGELNDLAAAQPGTVAALQAVLDQHLIDIMP